MWIDSMGNLWISSVVDIVGLLVIVLSIFGSLTSAWLMRAALILPASALASIWCCRSADQSSALHQGAPLQRAPFLDTAGQHSRI